ncbi:carbohydrate binding domain-containing protein [Lentisalinibacter sediminis]|uniref:carbohydrate binding domain-containing protein n=1 Tax=Lentisalinibacter sediminis TaxID=2992237 RepID=UPI00386DE7F1
MTPLPPSSGDPFDSGLLTNGDFEAGVDPWIGNAANVVDDGGNLVNFADITAAGQPFDVNLSQVVAITEGETYTLTFKARSDRARTILAGIGLNVEPFTNITETVNLTTDWQTFQFQFTATGFGGADSRVLFDMGADIGQVLIDDVSLTVAGPGGGDPSIDPDAALFTSAGAPDLVIPDDYLERTAFGSGSVIDPTYADDETYSPVLSVFSGTGYGANIAQVGFIGFPEGFLTQYETVDFKVKGMPGFVIFVKLFDGVDALRLNLTSSDYSAQLENGWFQVSIPVADFSGAAEATGIVFESDDSSATEFRMLLNDIGFSGTGTYVPADPGTIPEVTLYDRDGAPDLELGVDYTEISTFGSGADLDDDFRGDLDFRPVWSVTTGFGYDIWNAQLAYLGFDPGFAAPYATLDFKVKGLSGDVIRVKFLDDPDPPYVDIDVTASAYSTALGNGWYQVSAPLTEFQGVETATGLLFETIAPAPTESFTYLLTDIGFSGDAPVDTTTSLDFEADPASYSFDNFGGGESTVIGNPDQSGINTSGQVVQMTRTSESDFGGSTLALPEGVDWSQGEIFRMKVWSQRAVPVLFKIEGTPPAERGAGHDGGGIWQELCFDFTGENAGAPVTGISFFFDLGAVGDVANNPDDWTFYYDDIQQTSEPCPGPTAVDFEGDPASYSFDNFGGGESTVIANPDPSGINTTSQVVQMTRTSESDFGGSTLALPEGVDWGLGEIFTMKVWSQREVPVLFKVEGTPPAEQSDTHDGGSAWQELCFDFTDNNAGPPVTGISIFFDLGAVGDVANNPGDWTFYYDDIQQTSEPCPVAPPPAPEFTTITFDDPEMTYTLTDFGGTASTVTNDPTGGANQVVLTVKSDTAQVWAGTTVSTLPGEAVPVIPLDADNTQMSVRVYSPDAGIPVRVKIEDASDPAISVETEASTTVANDWETLVFDFANQVTGTAAFDPAATYNKISIFFNFGTDGATAGEKTYYFDDIDVGSGGGAPGGELLTNGDFEASDTDKAPWINAGTVATNTFYTVDAVDGGNVFDTNLSQVLDITQDAEYILTFRARATVARDIVAGIGLNVAPFTAVTVNVPLTTEWQTFSYNLTASGFGGADSRVLFDMGTVASTVNIDDVTLALASAPGANLLTNGDFEASDADKAPWINAGVVAVNNYYTVDAVDGGNVFDTNLSQVLDITQDTDYVLTFRARATVARDIVAGIGLNVAPFTAVTATVPLTTEWQTFSYDLTATGFGGPDSRVLFDMGTVASTVNIDDVSLTVADGGGGGGAVDIAVNGGFETGDFTGWTQFEATPGDQTINPSTAGDTSSEGVFHLEITNTASGTNSLIKQERVGLGTVTPGIAWTVTFDARGNLDPGAVAFAQVFSETTGGSENCAGCGILGSAPLGLNPDSTVWTSFTFSGTAGPNTESLTLQLEAVTGSSSLANVFYDNISIVVGDGGG